MRTLALAVLGLGLAGAMPAAALPVAGPSLIAPDAHVAEVQYRSRTVIRGARCKTVITKRRGPGGRMVVVRRRVCR